MSSVLGNEGYHQLRYHNLLLHLFHYGKKKVNLGISHTQEVKGVQTSFRKKHYTPMFWDSSAIKEKTQQFETNHVVGWDHRMLVQSKKKKSEIIFLHTDPVVLVAEEFERCPAVAKSKSGGKLFDVAFHLFTRSCWWNSTWRQLWFCLLLLSASCLSRWFFLTPVRYRSGTRTQQSWWMMSWLLSSNSWG